MNISKNDISLVLSVGEVFDPEENMNVPCISEIKSNKEPAWVASVMFLIYNKYVSSTDQENREKYSKEIKNYFNLMLSSAQDYLKDVQIT